VLLRLVADFRRAMDLSLVLDEEGIAHELRSMSDVQWALFVDDADAQRAESAVQAFERENPPPAARPRPDDSPPVGDGFVAGWLFGISLLAFHLWLGGDGRWYARGAADAAAIVRGEWWRTVTALTLHADEAHAAGNAALGGFLLAVLARRVGAGIASWLLLLSGIGGTWTAAALLRRNFESIGASTAVFGALGAVSVLVALDPARRRSAWLPLGAGLALLGFLGTSKRADLAGHLCGFAAGALLGALASRLPRMRSAAVQAALGMLAAAVPVAAWLRAFLVI